MNQFPGVFDAEVRDHGSILPLVRPKQSSLFIFVELDVQYLPIADTNAGVTALMTLVAIVAAEVAYAVLFIDGDLING